MKMHTRSFMRGFLNEERGQTMVFVALGMTAFLGISGVAVDLGHAYFARQQLVASTQAAALSGAVALPDTTAASDAVDHYSSITGGLNTSASLQNAQIITKTPTCLASITNEFGVPCLGAGSGYNVMEVTQQAQVPTGFARIFGVHYFNISATAYASTGGKYLPVNIAVIIDTTGSMNDNDSNCGHSQLTCALNGLEVMLRSLPSTADAPVALFTFPNVTASSAGGDISCGSVTSTWYTTPKLDTTYGPTGSNPTYEIVPFSSDYRTSNSAKTLNASSDLVKAAGQISAAPSNTTTKAGCLKVPGGPDTWTDLPGAITAAQSALVAENVLHPVANGQSVIVILTDGNINGSDQYHYANSSFPDMFTDSTLKDDGVYPSGVGGCGQSVQQAAVAKGSALQTSVFVIAYGALTKGVWNPNGKNLSGISYDDLQTVVSSSNCPSDQDAFFVAFKTHGSLTSTANVSTEPNKSPCQVTQDMASTFDPNYPKRVYFYSDSQGVTGSTACSSANASNVTSLSQIFQAITSTFSAPRLIPISKT